MLTECEHCSAVVDAKELHSYVVTDDIAPATRYTLASCPRCDGPLLLAQDEDFTGEGWDAPLRLFPSADSQISDALPKPIRAAFDEAYRCFRSKAYTAAALMCRKTLEGICVEHGIARRDLASSLAALRDNGVIDRRLFDWADALRISGNEAAHDVNVTIAPQDAADLLDFTRALIEYIFTFRDRFDAFQKRRAKKLEGA